MNRFLRENMAATPLCCLLLLLCCVADARFYSGADFKRMTQWLFYKAYPTDIQAMLVKLDSTEGAEREDACLALVVACGLFEKDPLSATRHEAKRACQQIKKMCSMYWVQ
jgi:hypothetical protein